MFLNNIFLGLPYRLFTFNENSSLIIYLYSKIEVIYSWSPDRLPLFYSFYHDSQEDSVKLTVLSFLLSCIRWIWSSNRETHVFENMHRLKWRRSDVTFNLANYDFAYVTLLVTQCGAGSSGEHAIEWHTLRGCPVQALIASHTMDTALGLSDSQICL